MGDAHHLEQLLHGAVLAVAAVERDEGQIGTGLGEPLHQVGAHVDRHDLVAEALERVLHPGARLQRYLSLERAAALENRDPAQARLRRNGRTLAGSWAVRAGGTGGATGAASRRGVLLGATPVSVP